MNQPRWIALIGTLAIILAFIGYYTYQRGSTNQSGQEHSDLTEEQIEARLQSLAKRIQSIQGSGQCSQSSQCKVVGLGAKVCGYQGDYLIYSTQDAQENALLQLVSEFNQMHEKMVKINLAVNKCGNPLPSSAKCVQSKCVAH